MASVFFVFLYLNFHLSNVLLGGLTMPHQVAIHVLHKSIFSPQILHTSLLDSSQRSMNLCCSVPQQHVNDIIPYTASGCLLFSLNRVHLSFTHSQCESIEYLFMTCLVVQITLILPNLYCKGYWASFRLEWQYIK